MIVLCNKCIKEFETHGRGRPPKKCPECRGKTQYPTVDRIENLEILLKSRGTHISQHRND